MASTLRNWRLALISILALGALPVWAQDTAPADTLPGGGDATQTTTPSASALNAELFYDLFVGELAAMRGDTTNAIALMMEAARQSQSQQLYQRAAAMALQSRSGQVALMVANEWQKNFPQSRDANRYLLQILLMLNRVSESQEALSRELAWSPIPAKTSTYLAVAQLYSRASDKPLAAAVVEQALQPDLHIPSIAPAAWATIGHMRLAAKQPDLALQALQHAHEQGPHEGATALLALELMEAGYASAQSVVQTYMAHTPAPTIQMAYARVLIGQERYDAAQQQLTPLLQSHPDMADAWMAQATLYAQQSQWTNALQAITRVEPLLQQIPQPAQRAQALAQAYLLAGRVALQQGDHAQALVYFEKIPNNAQTLSVQSLKAHALAQQGKLAQGRAMIRAFSAATPEIELKKGQAEVNLLRENNALDEAYLLQRSLHAQFPQDPDVAYETAILAERVGKLEVMERILKALIVQHPTHYHAFNALGYSYADRGIHLEDAKKLIQQALTMAPGDPFITDSLGWVEFRLGNKTLALELLEAAYAKRSDIEIAVHLGEVLWSLGHQSRARSIWEQAQQQDRNNTLLRETLERLQVRL